MVGDKTTIGLGVWISPFETLLFYAVHMFVSSQQGIQVRLINLDVWHTFIFSFNLSNPARFSLVVNSSNESS